MIAKCPLCEQPLPDTSLRWDDETRALIRNGKAVILAPLEYRAVKEIIKRVRGATKEQIHSAVYFDKQGEGPYTFAPRIYQINIKLKPLNIRIKLSGRWDGHYKICES